MLSLNESNNQPNSYEFLLLTLKNVFGIQLALHLLRCVELIQAYWHDPILIKLVLIIESLSSGTTRYSDERDMDRTYDDTLAIFASQNIYTELLWRYILSRLPSEEDAVKFFNKLILDLLVVVDVSFRTGTFVFSCPEELDKMDPLLKSILPASKKSIEIDNL